MFALSHSWPLHQSCRLVPSQILTPLARAEAMTCPRRRHSRRTRPLVRGAGEISGKLDNRDTVTVITGITEAQAVTRVSQVPLTRHPPDASNDSHGVGTGWYDPV